MNNFLWTAIKVPPGAGLFSAYDNIGYAPPPILPSRDIITENGLNLITEDGNFLLTET